MKILAAKTSIDINIQRYISDCIARRIRGYELLNAANPTVTPLPKCFKFVKWAVENGCRGFSRYGKSKNWFGKYIFPFLVYGRIEALLQSSIDTDIPTIEFPEVEWNERGKYYVFPRLSDKIMSFLVKIQHFSIKDKLILPNFSSWTGVRST